MKKQSGKEQTSEEAKSEARCCPEKDALIVRLEIVCAVKDSQIANLQSQLANERIDHAVQRLRVLEGVADDAPFDLQTMAFSAPPALAPAVSS